MYDAETEALIFTELGINDSDESMDPIDFGGHHNSVADPGFPKRGARNFFFFFFLIFFLPERVVPNTCRVHFNSIKFRYFLKDILRQYK